MPMFKSKKLLLVQLQIKYRYKNFMSNNIYIVWYAILNEEWAEPLNTLSYIVLISLDNKNLFIYELINNPNLC